MKKTEQRTDTDTSQPNMFYDLAFCVVGFTFFFFWSSHIVHNNMKQQIVNGRLDVYYSPTR